MKRVIRRLFDGRGASYVAETAYTGPDGVVGQLPPAALVHHSSLIRNTSKQIHGCRNQSAVGRWSAPIVEGTRSYVDRDSHNTEHASGTQRRLRILSNAATGRYTFGLEYVSAFVQGSKKRDMGSGAYGLSVAS